MPVTEPRNSQGLPLFSQSLEAQRLRQLPPAHNKFFVPQVILFSLPVLAIGALLIVARPNIAQTNQNASAAKLMSRAQNGDIGLETDDLGRRRLDFYTGGVRVSMFSPPQPPKPVVTKPIVVKIDKPKREYIPIVDSPLPINPFQDWTYTGVVTMGESRIALLENVKTKEGQYVRQGEGFLGGQVGAITDQSIILTLNGKSRTLAKSDTINLTPLSANAPFMQGGGQLDSLQKFNVMPQVSYGYQFPQLEKMLTTSYLSFQNISASDQKMINSAVMSAVSEAISEKTIGN